jgi:FkbM family methyltransferase
MALRDWVQAAGRILTRALLYPRWRHWQPIAWSYLHLYLLGKHITERHELTMIRRLVKPGMTVVDVGANVGFYTLQMSSGAGPAGRVLAFEPDPFCFRLLRSRVQRSRVQNVEAHQLAIDDHSGDAVLYCSAYNRADNRLTQSHDEPHVETHHVKTRSLDDFLSSEDLPAVSAIKIDVQGAEEHVLRGAQRTIAAGLEWIWIEFSPHHLHSAGTDSRTFLALLATLKMDVFEVDKAGRLRPLSDVEGYIRRIGAGYGDLVLLSHDHDLRTAAIMRGNYSA